MPPNSNPGTTPGTEPQAEGTTTNNPSSDGSNPPPKRLIAGKYETMEDAVEHGMLGLENAFHKTREDLARVTRVLESALAGGDPATDPRGGYAPVGTGYRGPSGQGYSRGQQTQEDFDAAQFLVNPHAVLQQREERMLRKVAGVVENVVANSMAVNDFKRQNPDLVAHERIVRAFMQETDPSKGYNERLVDAAGMTRKYLTELRAANGGNNNPPPAGNDFTEDPRGGNQFAPRGPQVGGLNPPNQMDPEEKELMDYISERNADISSRFGIKMK
jgi:hypothetical protein